MIKRDEFDQKKTLINNQKKVLDKLGQNLNRQITDAYRAVLAYIKTYNQANQEFKSYIDTQEELMYGEGDTLPFQNTYFPGITTKPRVMDDDVLEKTKGLNKLSTSINANLTLADTQINAAVSLLNSVINNLAIYKDAQDKVLRDESEILEDLDSPWDYYSQIGKEN